jgi:hypothetical protein
MLTLIINFAGYLLLSIIEINLKFISIAALSTIFALIALISIIVFIKGQTKEPGTQTIYTLVSISLKFLLEMVIALFWFFVFKKTSISSVLLFFILYLTFTFFSIWVILNTLKNNTL